MDNNYLLIKTQEQDRYIVKSADPAAGPTVLEPGQTYQAKVESNRFSVFIEDQDEPEVYVREMQLVTRERNLPRIANGQRKYRYPGLNNGHWVKRIINNGRIVVLEDGSLWQVAPMDANKALYWLPVANVTVMHNSGVFPYRLINLEDAHGSVNAFYLTL